MKEIRKDNVKILYNEIMYNKKEARKKKIKDAILIICSFALGIYLTFLFLDTSFVAEKGNPTFREITYAFVRYLLYVLLIVTICTICHAVRKKIYGEYEKLYGIINYILKMEKIESCIINGEPVLLATYEGNLKKIELKTLVNYIGSENIDFDMDEAPSGIYNVIIDATNFPKIKLSLEETQTENVCNSKKEAMT